MSKEEEYTLEDYAEWIMEDRALPYTLTVEKIEDGVFWTHNQWGNSVKYYEDDEGHFQLLKNEE